MDDTDLRDAFHDEDASTWALALSGASPPVRTRVVSALGPGSASALRGALDGLGPGPGSAAPRRPRPSTAETPETTPRLQMNPPTDPDGREEILCLASCSFPKTSGAARFRRPPRGVRPGRALDQVLAALVGTTPGFRQQLLTKLPAASAHQIEGRVSGHGPVSFGDVQAAQRELIEALCRLSRCGQVAFDDPEDMVA